MASDLPPPPPPPARPARPGWVLPALVGGGVLVVVLVVVVLVLVLTGDSDAADARSVDDVADLAVDAAEDLDVDAGIDLLCQAPTDDEVDELRDLIEAGQDEAGTDDPDVEYDVTEASGDAEGFFVVKVSSDEDGLADRGGSLKVFVGRNGDRSCITGVGDVRSDEPDDEVGA